MMYALVNLDKPAPSNYFSPFCLFVSHNVDKIFCQLFLCWPKNICLFVPSPFHLAWLQDK